MRAPHMLQKRASAGFCAPHDWQYMVPRSLPASHQSGRKRGGSRAATPRSAAPRSVRTA
jgi:hypothetical protein